MSVGMLNGQLSQLPLNRDDDPAYHGGPEGSSLTPWRREMLPPGEPGAFGTQRQIPSDGDLHVAQDASGYRMYPKEITPDHDGRQLPYEGDVAFDRMRLPTASYRTRAEAFKDVDYWSVKPVMGPEDWPSRKLFPGQPDMDVVDSIEHNILPLPYTQDNQRGYSVMDIPGVDFDSDEAEISELSGLGDDEISRAAEVIDEMVESGQLPDTDSAIEQAAVVAAGVFSDEEDEGDGFLGRSFSKKLKHLPAIAIAKSVAEAVKRKRGRGRRGRLTTAAVPAGPSAPAGSIVSYEFLKNLPPTHGAPPAPGPGYIWTRSGWMYQGASGVGISGLGYLGLAQADTPTEAQKAAAVDAAAKAIADAAKAKPTEAAKPGWLESALAKATDIAKGALALQTARVQARTARYVPGTTIPIPPGVELRNGTYVPVIEEPFYTKPSFLVLAALGLVGGGYLLLKK